MKGRPHVPLPPAKDRAEAKVVSLDSLPDANAVEPGTLVMIRDEARTTERSLMRSVLGALGRKERISRAARCTALLVRGYTRIGAGTDPDTDADMCWGYAPS